MQKNLIGRPTDYMRECVCLEFIFFGGGLFYFCVGQPTMEWSKLDDDSVSSVSLHDVSVCVCVCVCACVCERESDSVSSVSLHDLRVCVCVCV